MDIQFTAVDQRTIRHSHPGYFHQQARYFRAASDQRTLCLYGIIDRTTDHILAGEMFLMIKTFNGRVLSKGFLLAILGHIDTLGYAQVWTWTKWPSIARLLGHLTKFGVTAARCPPWDNDPDKQWFIKQVCKED